jgi:hypothetical protein
MSLLLLASLLLSTPYFCEGPWFRELTPTGVPIVAGIIGVASVPAGASIPAIAACMASLQFVGVFNVSPAACILTILPPAVLLMLASCWCLRPALADVTTVAGVTAIAGVPTLASVPELLAFLRMLSSLALQASLLFLLIRLYRKFNITISWNPPCLCLFLPCGHWPFHYVLTFIAQIQRLTSLFRGNRTNKPQRCQYWIPNTPQSVKNSISTLLNFF